MRKRILGVVITVAVVVLLSALGIHRFSLPKTAEHSVNSGTEFDLESPSLYVNGDYMGYYQTDAEISVSNTEEAIQAAISLGLCNTPDHLALDNVTEMNGEIYYQLQQVYDGIPVYGHRVFVLTDENHMVSAASGDYIAFDHVDATPTFAWSDIIQVAEEYAQNTLGTDDEENITLGGKDDSALVIYLDENGSARLAYSIQLSFTGGIYDMIIDAQNGEILWISDAVMAYTSVTGKVDGYSRDFQLLYDEENGNYIFQDPVHRFSLYDAGGHYTCITLGEEDDEAIIEKRSVNEGINPFGHPNPVGRTISEGLLTEPVSTSDLSTVDKLWADIYCSAVLTYDYFFDVLCRDGFNANGGAVKWVCNSNGILFDNGEFKTNTPITYANRHDAAIFYTGSEGNEVHSSDPNVATHEYSHAVEQTISGMAGTATSETSALQESYSDLFGELSEAYYTGKDPDWKNSARQLYPGNASESTVFDYHEYLNSDGIDGHSAGTITSYAMVKVWRDWRNLGLSVDECMTKMSVILYRSLFLMPQDANFSDFAYALMTSAGILYQQESLSYEQIQRIYIALQDAEILGPEAACLLQVTDAVTGESLKGASVTLTVNLQELSYFKDPKQFQAYTDERGICTIHFLSGAKDYPVTVTADGYQDYNGWVNAVAADTSDDSQPYPINEIALLPITEDGPTTQESTDRKGDNLLKDKLSELIATYGVIAYGTEEYTHDYSNSEIVVSPDRLSGLLCADIYDYDEDGTNELVTLRVDPNGYTQVRGNSPSEVMLFLSVYDKASDGTVALASEQQIPFRGIPDSYYSSSVQLVRGDVDGQACLYLDYYFNFNSQSFGILQLTYDGSSLEVTGGAECSEFAYAVCCDIPLDTDALDSLCGRQFHLDYSSWLEGERYDWEGQTNPASDYFNEYRWEYQGGMEAIRLMDSNPRTWVNSNIGGSMQFIYACCMRRPTDHYTLSDGTLTELGGILSPYAQGSVTLECYGNLDEYRVQGSASTSGESTSGSSNPVSDQTVQTSSAGFKNPSKLFYAFSDAFLAQDAEAIAALYSKESEAQRSQLAELWKERLSEVHFTGIDGIKGMYFAESLDLSSEELAAHYDGATMPEAACRLNIGAYPDWSQVWPDWLASGIELYAAQYGGEWFLTL